MATHTLTHLAPVSLGAAHVAHDGQTETVALIAMPDGSLMLGDALYLLGSEQAHDGARRIAACIASGQMIGTDATGAAWVCDLRCVAWTGGNRPALPSCTRGAQRTLARVMFREQVRAFSAYWAMRPEWDTFRIFYGRARYDAFATFRRS